MVVEIGKIAVSRVQVAAHLHVIVVELSEPQPSHFLED